MTDQVVATTRSISTFRVHTVSKSLVGGSLELVPGGEEESSVAYHRTGPGRDDFSISTSCLKLSFNDLSFLSSVEPGDVVDLQLVRASYGES